MVEVVPPVEARLLEPLEVVGVERLALLVHAREVVGHVALVHMDRHERLDLGAVHLRAEVLQAPRRELGEHGDLARVDLLHRVLLARALLECGLRVGRPHELDAEQREQWRGLIKDLSALGLLRSRDTAPRRPIIAPQPQNNSFYSKLKSFLTGKTTK